MRNSLSIKIEGNIFLRMKGNEYVPFNCCFINCYENHTLLQVTAGLPSPLYALCDRGEGTGSSG